MLTQLSRNTTVSGLRMRFRAVLTELEAKIDGLAIKVEKCEREDNVFGRRRNGNFKSKRDYRRNYSEDSRD